MAERRANVRALRRVSPRVRRNRAVLAFAAALSVLVGAIVVHSVAGGKQLVAATPRATMTSATAAGAAGAATTAATTNRRGSGQAVTLAFGGDVHFEGRLRTRLEADPSTVLAGVAPLLKAADVAVVNLETAVTLRGIRAAGKQYTFRAPPAAFEALKAGGVDVATMANNHGMDYGRQGLGDSLEAATAADFPVVGIGRDAGEAYRPFETVVKGQRIAILGATQVLDGDLATAWTATDSQPGLASAKNVDRLTAAVRETRGRADTVVVYLHWGTEGATCPNAEQPDLARALVEAGADVVVGTHAHRLQGAGRMGSAVVAYGLGNLAFYADTGPATESGILTVTIVGREVERYGWAPAQLVGQAPRTLTGAAAGRASAGWDGLRACTGLGS